MVLETTRVSGVNHSHGFESMHAAMLACFVRAGSRVFLLPRSPGKAKAVYLTWKLGGAQCEPDNGCFLLASVWRLGLLGMSLLLPNTENVGDGPRRRVRVVFAERRFVATELLEFEAIGVYEQLSFGAAL